METFIIWTLLVLIDPCLSSSCAPLATVTLLKSNEGRSIRGTINGESVNPPLPRLVSSGILIFQRIPSKCFKSFKLVAVTWSWIKNLPLPMKSKGKLFVYIVFVYTPHWDIPWKLILIAKIIWNHSTTSMLTNLVLFLRQVTTSPLFVLLVCLFGHVQTSTQNMKLQM